MSGSTVASLSRRRPKNVAGDAALHGHPMCHDQEALTPHSADAMMQEFKRIIAKKLREPS